MDITPDDALTRGVATGRRALQKMMEGKPEARPRPLTQQAYLEHLAPDLAEARARGYSYKEIARWLNISPETAKTLDLGSEGLTVTERAVRRSCSDTTKVVVSTSLKAKKEQVRKPRTARMKQADDQPPAGADTGEVETAARDLVDDPAQASTATVTPSPQGKTTSGSPDPQTPTDSSMADTAEARMLHGNWPESRATANHARMAEVQALAGRFADAKTREMARQGRQEGPGGGDRRGSTGLQQDEPAELPF